VAEPLGTPSPLVGEGRGGGVVRCGNAVPRLPTPTPNPSPQGGGEEFAALLTLNLTPMGAGLVPARTAGGCGPQGGHKGRPYEGDCLCRPFNFS
jgi:hypothetical protein